jgi:vacuolar-type H+-ATPase subunit H
LSKEIIVKIKEAEAQAQEIRSSAEDEAKARIRRAQTEGRALCDKTEARVSAANREKLKVAEERAEEVLNKTLGESEDEAQKMREEAEFNMREAIRAIIAGVKEQCQ